MCGKGQQISHLFGPGTNVLICFWVSFWTVRPLRFRFCRRRQICCSSTKHIFCELDPVPGIYCDSVKNDCFRQRDTGVSESQRLAYMQKQAKQTFSFRIANLCEPDYEVGAYVERFVRPAAEFASLRVLRAQIRCSAGRARAILLSEHSLSCIASPPL